MKRQDSVIVHTSYPNTRCFLLIRRETGKNHIRSKAKDYLFMLALPYSAVIFFIQTKLVYLWFLG